MWAIAAACVAVFVQELHAADPDRFIDAFAAIPYDLTHGIVLAPPSPPVAALTLVTSMFVHGSALHLGFNLLFLLAFGPAVERRCGHLRFSAFYLLCGVAGGLAQVAFAPGSHLPTIGASGAIAGVLGGYAVQFPLASFGFGDAALHARVPALLVILAWAAAQFVSAFDALGAVGARAAADGGVAYLVHVGGFCAGVVTIGLFAPRGAGKRPRRSY